MGASYPTKLFLAFRSGDCCAFPGCDTQLTIDGKDAPPAVIGEAAHITGENAGAARYDLSMTDEQRNHHANLIYLCCNHHTQIDKQENDFPVDRLLRMKHDHEQAVQEAIAEAFSTIGFPELAEATEWILALHANGQPSDFSLVAPEDKIKTNELMDNSRLVITMGLSVAREVKSFVTMMAQADAGFPEKLKAGFLEEYYRLRNAGHRGDVLFDFMCRFAQRGFKEQGKKSAGLAVLIYLFEACEVFEK